MLPEGSAGGDSEGTAFPSGHGVAATCIPSAAGHEAMWGTRC